MAETSYRLNAKGHNQAVAKGSIIKITLPNYQRFLRVLKIDGVYAKVLWLDSDYFSYSKKYYNTWTGDSYSRMLKYAAGETDDSAHLAEEAYNSLPAELKNNIKSVSMPKTPVYALSTNPNDIQDATFTVISSIYETPYSMIKYGFTNGNTFTAHLFPLTVDDLLDYFGKKQVTGEEVRTKLTNGSVYYSIYAGGIPNQATCDIWYIGDQSMPLLHESSGASGGVIRPCCWLDLRNFEYWETYQ